MEFFVIADGWTYLAFALAGVEGGVAADAGEVRDLLAQALKNPEVGLLLITERLAEQVRGEVDQMRRDQARPLIVEIPDLEGPLATRATLMDRIHALLGLPR